MSNYQVVWRGIVHDSTGYSRASREYLLSLDRAGVDVKVEPMNFGSPPTELSTEQANRISELIQKPYATDKKKVLIYHAQPSGINVEAERSQYDYVIINTVWETTRIPASWFPGANLCDAIIVPSEQNVQALRDSGVTAPIYKVPHGADFERFNPNNAPFHLPQLEDRFAFLSIFQWQHRKAPDMLLKAFWSEFTAEEKVILVMKTYWGHARHSGRVIRSRIFDYKEQLGFTNTAPLYLTTSPFSDDQLKGLYTMADVFVLPSRGEGVGLPYIEALCSGIPVIATGWGGQTDFLTDQNSLLINYTLESTRYHQHTLAPDFHDLFTADMQWAEPNIDSLRKAMRWFYEHRFTAPKVFGRLGREDMMEMSWDNAGQRFKQTIEEVIS